MSLIDRRWMHPKRNLYLGVGVLLLALSTLLFGTSPTKASAADCDNNAIISCGETSPSAFINQVKANDSKNGHHDLPAIFADYGMIPAQYGQFVATARMGTAYKDGRIVVDGQVVATNSTSIGRLAANQGPGYFTKVINGVTYYGNVSSRAFAHDSIPVMVMFNGQGVMQFAVLTSCSNPITGTKVTPSYSCNALQKTPVAGKANTYNFTTSASAANNAAVVKVVYNFDDGATATVSAPGTVVQHTYSKPGNYTARVTVYVSLPGNQTVIVTSAKCATTIKVVAPYYSCVQLAGAILDKTKFKYSFVVTASFGNGATFTSADFDFGDHNATNGVKPTGTSASTMHQYATAGDYTAKATLHFSVNGVAASVSCTAKITPTQPPTPECKPGVPEGSALCTPCATNPSVSASDTANCVAPASTLPNTGAGDVIAIFGAVVIVGFIFYRQFIYRKHRAVGNDAAAINLGQHMVAGARQPDHSAEMVQHLSHADHHTSSGIQRPHPNASRALHHHPTYRRSNRFRPGNNHDKPES